MKAPGKSQHDPYVAPKTQLSSKMQEHKQDCLTIVERHTKRWNSDLFEGIELPTDVESWL